MNPNDVLIAGWKSASDWAAFRTGLVVGGGVEGWNSAYKDYFHTRLDLRYLHPIRLLQEHGTFQGEGFSILAIQCTLMEFLESTIQGLKYRHCQKRDLQPFEYCSSKALFVSFLTKREPFAQEFDVALAEEFYTNVRCGLLHEASTKDGWRVAGETSKGPVVDRSQKIVFRNRLVTALDAFLKWYEGELPKNSLLQEAFIRKFNNLCA